MSTRRIWLWLPIVGVALHLAFLLFLGPIHEIDERQQWEQARKELNPRPLGDPEFNYTMRKAFVVPCVYCPSVLFSLVISGFRLFKLQEDRFWSWLGITLGVFTALYVFGLLSP